LTEDLQPGDVFLVQIPIQKQEQLYKERGFVPLDQLVVRLQNLDYGRFYFPAYFKQYYPGKALERPQPDPNSKERRFRDAPLPMAAFPTYSFKIDMSTGLQIAIPVKGIPVGLGLMNAESATGSVTISDGMTYAIGTDEALRSLYDWADDPEVRQMLRDVQLTTEGEVYLRVVTRIYLMGAVETNLLRRQIGSAGMDVGQAPSVDLINLKAETGADANAVVKAYGNFLEELSKPLAGAVPGGSLRIAWASRNMVVLKEKFPRLLAIGYLGFDVGIIKDGTLGPPIATRDHIDPDLALRPLPQPAKGPVAWATIFNLYRMLTATEASPEEKQLADSMDVLFNEFDLPDGLVLYKMTLDDETGSYKLMPRPDRGAYDKGELKGFQRLNALYGVLSDSIDALNDGIAAQQSNSDTALELLRQYQSHLDQQKRLRQSLQQTAHRYPAIHKALQLYFDDVLN
jgi:hypothetical protein